MVEVIVSGLPLLGGAVLDAAWEDKWGVSSAGSEEAARTAARQDVISDAVGAFTSLVGTSPEDSRFVGNNNNNVDADFSKRVARTVGAPFSKRVA